MTVCFAPQTLAASAGCPGRRPLRDAYDMCRGAFSRWGQTGGWDGPSVAHLANDRTRRAVAYALACLTCAVAPLAAAAEADPERAQALVGAREFLLAIDAAESAIDTIERGSHRYDMALAEPLVALGDALAQVGDSGGALGAYERAVQVMRVNRGLHHPDQVEVIYREAAVHATTGDYGAANARHEYAYDILLRSHGATSTELLPGMFTLADWYLTTYDIFSARGLFEHAEKVARAEGRASGARLRALRGIAATYRAERFPPGYVNTVESPRTAFSRDQRWASTVAVNAFGRGERALIEVVNAVREHPDAQPTHIAGAMLELGDWFLMFEKQGRAEALYRRAWELLEDEPGMRRVLFGQATPLYLPLPRPPKKPEGATGPPRKGVVELSVDVGENGQVGRIDTLRSEPEGKMDFRVRRAARRARYRPVFTEEGPHPSDDIRIVFQFEYFDAPSEREAASTTAESEGVGAGDRPRTLEAATDA